MRSFERLMNLLPGVVCVRAGGIFENVIDVHTVIELLMSPPMSTFCEAFCNIFSQQQRRSTSDFLE